MYLSFDKSAIASHMLTYCGNEALGSSYELSHKIDGLHLDAFQTTRLGSGSTSKETLHLLESRVERLTGEKFLEERNSKRAGFQGATRVMAVWFSQSHYSLSTKAPGTFC